MIENVHRAYIFFFDIQLIERKSKIDFESRFSIAICRQWQSKTVLAIFDPHSSIVKGIYLSKALTLINFFLYKQKMFFNKETDTFGHIVV